MGGGGQGGGDGGGGGEKENSRRDLPWKKFNLNDAYTLTKMNLLKCLHFSKDNEFAI